MPWTYDGERYETYRAAYEDGYEDGDLSRFCPCGCGGDSECEDDYESEEYDDFYGSSRLHGYSYTPDLVFHGQGPAFYGMEIEISCRGTKPIDVAERMGGDLTYLKADGSVAGFELVTHPMAYPWAMGGDGTNFRTGFPWEMLPEVKDAGAYIDESTNGIHIHVSRAGFGDTTKDPGRRGALPGAASHQYRWLKFIYRNQDMCETIARRRGSHWARFSDGHRKSHLVHLKPDVARKIAQAQQGTRGRTPEERCPFYRRYNRVCSGCRNGFGCDYGPEYNRGPVDGTQERYSAVNCTNSPTFEVRIFASTLDPEEARACLGLVAGSVEYTRQLTAHDVAKANGWSWDAFARWAGDTGGYSDLLHQADRLAHR